MHNLEGLPQTLVYPYFIDLTNDDEKDTYLAPFNSQKFYPTMMDTSITVTLMNRMMAAYRVVEFQPKLVDAPASILSMKQP